MQSLFRVIALSLLMAFAGSAGAAQIDAAKMDAAKKAADEFLGLAKGSETNGQVPRNTEPKIRQLLDTIFDRRAFGPEVLPIGESAKIGELLNNGNRVGFVYMLAGTGLSDLNAIATDQKAMERAESNMAAFAPEIGRWFDYQMAIQGAITDSTLDFLDTATKEVLERPQVKSGLGNVRAGVAKSLSGVLQTMGSGTMDDTWRRDRLVSLAEIAPKAAKIMEPGDARELKDQAVALASTMSDPALKAGLTKFADAITPKP